MKRSKKRDLPILENGEVPFQIQETERLELAQKEADPGTDGAETDPSIFKMNSLSKTKGPVRPELSPVLMRRPLPREEPEGPLSSAPPG